MLGESIDNQTQLTPIKFRKIQYLSKAKDHDPKKRGLYEQGICENDLIRGNSLLQEDLENFDSTALNICDFPNNLETSSNGDQEPPRKQSQ